MCGVYSQGLIMPLSMFPEIPADVEDFVDVTDLLKVKYYVPEDNERKADNPNSRLTINSKYQYLYKKPFIKKMLKYK